MNHMCAIVISVFNNECDAFVAFSHILENVFPLSFFSEEDRMKGYHTELRIFALMAEIFVPELSRSLTAVHTEGYDRSPFSITMKRSAEYMFRSLFSTVMFYQDVLRVWDICFVYKFEFAQKFAAYFIGTKEKKFRRFVNNEIKNIGLGPTSDCLVVVGTLAKNRAFSKIEKLPIDKIIKKTLTKAYYSEITRKNLLSKAKEFENSLEQRTDRLKMSKSFFQTYLDRQTVTTIIDDLVSLDHSAVISRQSLIEYLRDKFQWSASLAVNLFATFDQLGNDSIGASSLLSGIILISSGSLADKIHHLFYLFDKNKNGSLDSSELTHLIEVMENTFDFRSNLLQANARELLSSLDSDEDGKVDVKEFTKAVTQDYRFEHFYFYLKTLEDEDNQELEFNPSGTSSPMTSAKSPISDLSYDASDTSEIEHRLNHLANNIEIIASTSPIEIVHIDYESVTYLDSPKHIIVDLIDPDHEPAVVSLKDNIENAEIDRAFENSLKIDKGFENSLKIDEGFENSLKIDKGFENGLGIDTNLENEGILEQRAQDIYEKTEIALENDSIDSKELRFKRKQDYHGPSFRDREDSKRDSQDEFENHKTGKMFETSANYCPEIENYDIESKKSVYLKANDQVSDKDLLLNLTVQDCDTVTIFENSTKEKERKSCTRLCSKECKIF